MTFYTFMMRNYFTSDSPAGDLARDMKEDPEKFPRNRPCKFDAWRGIIYLYLIKRGATCDCLDIFEECWEEYLDVQKRK